MSLNLSRRRWVLLMGSAPLLAQTAAPPAALTTEQRLEKAKAGVRDVSEKLAGLAVPMSVEPAFRFVA